ncbi:hypothetical protein K7432_005994 [Basidiobolus ranarum]|uniref:Peptidase C51 domain-containing protein n=1 Tax=Basidiobolus ranarum TaxID=34480 RepID=A0ABR2WVR6_9FUNG
MYSGFFLCTLLITVAISWIHALPVHELHAESSTQAESSILKPRYYYSYKNSWGSNPKNTNGYNNSGGNYNPKNGGSNTTPKTPTYNKGSAKNSNSNGDSATGVIGKLEFRFNNGQCTDWADARYAQLTGHHIQWWGDARTWTSKAQSTQGWTVSTKAKQPSIIVIQPGVQGTGSAGHVAVVERVESNGDAYTSNYNYNGGPYIKKYATFKPGNGVSFISHN